MEIARECTDPKRFLELAEAMQKSTGFKATWTPKYYGQRRLPEHRVKYPSRKVERPKPVWGSHKRPCRKDAPFEVKRKAFADLGIALWRNDSERDFIENHFEPTVKPLINLFATTRLERKNEWENIRYKENGWRIEDGIEAIALSLGFMLQNPRMEIEPEIIQEPKPCDKPQWHSTTGMGVQVCDPLCVCYAACH